MKHTNKLRFALFATFVLAFFTLIPILPITESSKPEQNQSEALLISLPEELVFDSSKLQNWLNFTDSSSDISFSYPQDWSVSALVGDVCNPYNSSQKFCVTVSSPDSLGYLLIKVEQVTKEKGGSILRGDSYLTSLMIRTKEGNITLLRSNVINGLYDYKDKRILELKFINELYDEPKKEEKDGQLEYGLASNWHVTSGGGYTVTYFLDDSVLEDSQYVNSSELVKTLDNIVSTLEFNFEADPFE